MSTESSRPSALSLAWPARGPTRLGPAIPYRQTNVSYSLVQRKDGEVVRHTLIYCGMGVVPSLLEFEHTHGVRVVFYSPIPTSTILPSSIGCRYVWCGAAGQTSHSCCRRFSD